VTLSTAVLRARHKPLRAGAGNGELARERAINHRVSQVWGLLVLNALTFYPGISFLHIPSAVGKLITQGALPLALVLALTVNRKMVIRPNVFLTLVSLIVVEALMTTLQPQHLGTVYRTFRLAEFIVTLWLLTPWWGRRDLLLLRSHLIYLSALLATVFLGLIVAPGHARAGGRLSGVIWPVPATEVGHYAAMVFGLVVVMWFCGLASGRVTLFAVVFAGAILVLSHTRTALVAAVAAILVAGLSLIVAKRRVRKLFAVVSAFAVFAIVTLSSFITTWLARGEGTKELFNLTGRTATWSLVVTYPRNLFQVIFGFGLSNSSFNGLPIDSNWLASYDEQGLFGVIICVIILLFLFIMAYFQPRSPRRALALFLVTYCLIASFTETGFTDVSAYMLELTLCASLLVPLTESRSPV
jgi:hypothetical protein